MNDVADYITKDLHESAALLAKGAKFLRLRRDTNFFWFVFQDKSVCEEISSSFWSGDLQVDAKEYANALKTLKDRLFSQGGEI